MGYARAVGGSLPITDELRDQLRRQLGAEGLEAFEASVAARRQRRFVALYWESAGDELGWMDDQSSGAGQLNHRVFLDLVHRPQVQGWLIEPQVDLGSSEASGTHALMVDRQTGQAWVAPMATARVIVRAQRLEDSPLG